MRKKSASGSAKLGPSKAYLRLLEGRTTAEEYARTVRRSVDMKRSGTTHRVTRSKSP